MNGKIVVGIVIVAIAIGAISLFASQQEDNVPVIEEIEQTPPPTGKVIDVEITERLGAGT